MSVQLYHTKLLGQINACYELFHYLRTIRDNANSGGISLQSDSGLLKPTKEIFDSQLDDIQEINNNYIAVYLKFTSSPEIDLEQYIKTIIMYSFDQNISKKMKQLLLFVPKAPGVTNTNLGITEFSYINDNKSINNLTPGDTIMLIKNYYENNLFTLTPRGSITRCICGEELKYSDLNEVICPCGIINDSIPDIEYVSISKIRSKPKSRNDDARIHCVKWLQQLQAIEQTKIQDSLLNELDKKLRAVYIQKNHRKSLEDLKCSEIRSWLKELGQTTKWNKHAPLIRKLLAARHGYQIIPPMLQDHEQRLIIREVMSDMLCFDKLVERKILPTSLIKKPYYPYIILQNIRRELKNDPRIAKFADCMHFQSRETLVKDDEIYREICRYRGKKPLTTDKNELIGR